MTYSKDPADWDRGDHLRAEREWAEITAGLSRPEERRACLWPLLGLLGIMALFWASVVLWAVVVL